MIAAPAGIRLNLGCGDYPVDGFVNVDAVQSVATDIVLAVPPLPWKDGIVSEIYMGHFLEHLYREQADELLRECHRVLQPGGAIGVVVPDFEAIAERYLDQDEPAPFEWAGVVHDVHDLDALCHFLLYSTCQPSQHHWMYDRRTLRRALERAGFEVTGEIDRFTDRRLSTSRWYQTGLDARKV